MRMRFLGIVFCAVADGDEEDGAVAFGAGREEAGDVIVKEREAGGAKALGVSRQIELAAKDASFQLHRAIAAIAEALEDGPQVREEKDVHGGVRGQLLLHAQVPGIGAEVSLLQSLKHTTTTTKEVGAGRQPFHGVDD